MDQLVGNNNLLSPSFAKWYSRIFSSLISENRISKDMAEDSKLKYVHPHQFLLTLKSVNPKSDLHLKAFLSENIPYNFNQNEFWSNDAFLVDFINSTISDTFDKYYESLAPVSSGSLFLDKGTTPRLIIIDQNITYVVVCVNSLNEYLSNYYKVNKILFTKDGCGVVEKIGVIKTNSKEYFISRYKGFDFESEIIENKKNELIKQLLEWTVILDKCFTDNKLFVRNLAPRNMVNGFEKVYIIDFDHIYDLSKIDHLDLITQMFSRRLWYSDIYDKETIQKMFKIDIRSDLNKYSECDDFEKKYFGTTSVKISEKFELYDLVNNFESKSTFFDYDIYGHQLGRFVTDFWELEAEVKLYKYLNNNKSKIGRIKAILYFVSKIDQELLLRKKYGLSSELSLLSANSFEWIEKKDGELKICRNLLDEFKKRSDFESQYDYIWEKIN